MAVAFAYYVLLYLQVLVYEVGAVYAVGHYAAYECCCEEDVFRLFFVEQFAHGNRVEQICFLMGAPD